MEYDPRSEPHGLAHDPVTSLVVQIRDGLVDLTLIRPIARLGYMDYSVVDNTFTMLRADTDRPGPY